MYLIECGLPKLMWADDKVALAPRHDCMGWWWFRYFGTSDPTSKFSKCVVEPLVSSCQLR